MQAAELPLSPINHGDTWDGIPSIAVSINGIAPTSVLASVEMEWHARSNPFTVELLLTSAALGGIVITSAANWEFNVPARLLGFSVGTHDWYLTTIDDDGDRKTYLKGTLEVLRT